MATENTNNSDFLVKNVFFSSKTSKSFSRFKEYQQQEVNNFSLKKNKNNKRLLFVSCFNSPRSFINRLKQIHITMNSQ